MGVLARVLEAAGIATVGNDARVRKLYRALCEARRKASPAGVSPSPRLKWNLSRLDAMTKLIKEERFFYLGIPEKAPHYRNTASVRYFSTQMDGLKVILEIQQNEFPDVFNKPKLNVKRARRG